MPSAVAPDGTPLAFNKVATPPPPQFVHDGTPYSESEIFWITKHGLRRSGMSAYGPFYSDGEIWKLAAFVKRLDHLSSPVLEGIQPGKP